MNRLSVSLLVVTGALGAFGAGASSPAIDLSGEWSVRGTNLCGRLSLPGTLADAKLGQPMSAEDWRKTKHGPQKGALMRAYQYTGKATYSREIEIPSALAGKALEIVLERVMWKSTVRWDGETLGSEDSLSTPHLHLVPVARATAGRHRLEIEVDNARLYNLGNWSHAYGPTMQSVWHGLLGKLEIRPVDPLRDARVFPAPVQERKVSVEVPVDFHAVLGETLKVEGLKAVSLSEVPSPYRKDRKLVTVALGETPVAWNEFHPKLYALVLGKDASRTIRFGFRQIATRGHDILLNGQRFFLRGNLDCCNFPLSGSPAMDKAGWRRIFERIRREGVNTVRFHSWCPPEAAFEAADELGLCLCPEATLWIERWMKDGLVGHGKPIDAFVQREIKAILAAYGNHPSFISLGIGNECASDCNYAVMGAWLKESKRDDPRHLYFATTMRTISPGDDYFVTIVYPKVGKVRQRFEKNNDWDYEKLYSRCDLPCVAHEIGQWASYPDWNELKKYTGVLKPYNLEALKAKAVQNNTLRFNREYAEASVRLTRLMYRDEVESFLRTPSCSGFELLSVQDFSGQFEALIGWLDSFYDVKPAARDLPPFSTVCNATPHLARFPKYVWKDGETFEATLLVRNLTDAALPAGRAFAWSSGSEKGEFRLSKPLAVGDLVEVGKVRFPLSRAEGAKRTLRFGANEWTFWVFPNQQAAEAPTNVVLTDDYETMVKSLKAGGRVVYLGDSVDMGVGKFKPLYWSTGFFPSTKADLAATHGAWIDAAHPALAGFPTENWTDFQWRHLAEGYRYHRLKGLPDDYRPIILPIPDLRYSTFFGSLFELRVGDGRLLVCGYAIDKPDDPTAIALRNSILDYAASDRFQPVSKTDFTWLDTRFRPNWRDHLAPRPVEYREAPVYIECALGQMANGRRPWNGKFDRAELAKGTYRVDGQDFGSWKDKTGTYWFGRTLRFTLSGLSPTDGELHVRFRDPNRQGRVGRGTFEGTAFDVPLHQNNPGNAYWVRLPFARKQTLDGRLEFTFKTVKGPNLMIDRIAVVPSVSKELKQK